MSRPAASAWLAVALTGFACAALVAISFFDRADGGTASSLPAATAVAALHSPTVAPLPSPESSSQPDATVMPVDSPPASPPATPTESTAPTFAPPTPVVPPSIPPPSDDPEHLDLEIQTYVKKVTPTVGPPTPKYRYVVVVRNPNRAVMPLSVHGTSVDLYANFYEGARLVGSAVHALPTSYLEPGGSTVIVGNARSGSPSRIEATVVVRGWSAGTHTPRESKINGLRMVSEGDDTYRISGSIRWPYLGVPGMHVIALFHNANDEIIDVVDRTMTSCTCGRTEFEITSDPQPNLAYVTVLWRESGGGAIGATLGYQDEEVRLVPERPHEPRHQALEVRSGFWLEDGLLSYAFVVRNPNDTVRPTGNADVSIKLFDDLGMIQELTSRVSGAALSPGLSVGRMGLPFKPTRTPTRIEATAAATWERAKEDWSPLFRLQNVRTTAIGGDHYTTNGELYSHSALGAPGVTVSVVYFDEGGAIISAQDVTVDHCGCGLTPISITSAHPIPDYASAEMYWFWPFSH